MALRAIVPRRDQLIAASLTGAVVIVVGYASGLGLKPGTAAENPPPVIAQPAPSGQSPVPDGKPPPPASIPSLPAVPVTDAPAPVAPPGPGGGVDASPSAPPPEPVPPTHPHPEPPTTSPPPPPEELPNCQSGAVQQVLDTVAALPLLGGVTAGLGVTGADGLGATLLGYCRADDGTVVLETVPVPAR